MKVLKRYSKLSTKAKIKLYDRLYDIANKHIKKCDPCKIQIKGNEIKCLNYKHTLRKKNLCCTLCNNSWALGKKGCRIKCLGCKLYFCESIRKDNKALKKMFFKLENIMGYYRLSDYYRSRTAAIYQLNLKSDN